MKISTYDAPHIHHHENTRLLMVDTVLMMVFIYGMAFYYYRTRVLALLLVSVVTAVLCDWACTLIAGKRPHIRDLSAVVTGMLVPLLMPASVDYSIVITAVVFGIVVAKHPFGGVGHNVFNPAAAGFSFTVICFGDRLFRYPLPFDRLPVFGEIETALVSSPAFTLQVGGTPSYDIIEMALGNYPGPMGATNILVILACLLYLVFRNTVRWEMPVCFFLTVAAFAWCFPRVGLAIDSTVRLQSVMFEMMSGILLLCGVFMLGDPVTTPKRDWSKVAFGIVAGLMVMIFRRFGRFEEEFTFAILLMNAAVWGFDMLGERLASFVRRKRRANRRREKIPKKA